MANLPLYDKQTKGFFDTYAPEYSTEDFKYLFAFVQRTSNPESSFIDLACGSGNVLSFFSQKARIGRAVGVDISTTLVEQARRRKGLEIHEASLLDETLSETVGLNYDYAMLSKVLHHLVGNTRTRSKANVRWALRNSLRLLKRGGYLLIYEPFYYPSLAGDLVFWIKRLITKFYPRRLDFLMKFHNIGLPVVSYLTPGELKRMLGNVPGCRIVEWTIEYWHVRWLMRLGLIGSCGRLSCVVRKL